MTQDKDNGEREEEEMEEAYINHQTKGGGDESRLTGKRQ